MLCGTELGTLLPIAALWRLVGRQCRGLALCQVYSFGVLNAAGAGGLQDPEDCQRWRISLHSSWTSSCSAERRFLAVRSISLSLLTQGYSRGCSAFLGVVL